LGCEIIDKLFPVFFNNIFATGKNLDVVAVITACLIDPIYMEAVGLVTLACDVPGGADERVELGVAEGEFPLPGGCVGLQIDECCPDGVPVPPESAGVLVAHRLFDPEPVSATLDGAEPRTGALL
jgi:hypothetical protein